MLTRTLGKTGIEVSEIGLGCWALGGVSYRGGVPTGWAGTNIWESLETVRKAKNYGITLYDTADAYGRGKSEVIVGMGLDDNKQDAVIASKAGNSLAAPGQDFSEAYIRGALDASMTRLEVDCIDLYQLHGPKVEVMTDQLFDLMGELKASGKIRAWGVSVLTAEEAVHAINGGAETIQLVYNILQQDIGKAVFPLAKEYNVGIIAREPLASGWLTGKYGVDTVFTTDDHRSKKFPPARIQEFGKKVEQLKFLLDEADTLAQAALRFILAEPLVSTVIAGCKSVAQLDENASASGQALSSEAMARIEALNF